MFTIPPSLPVGQSEERSDGSSSGSGAGTGPGESSVYLASDKVAQSSSWSQWSDLGIRREGLFFSSREVFGITVKSHLHAKENGAVCSDDCNVCPVVFLAVIWCVCVCVCIIIHPSKLLVNVANFKNFVKFKKKKKVSVFYSTFHSSLKLSVIRYLYCHCTVIHSTRVLCSTMKLENRHINLSP